MAKIQPTTNKRKLTVAGFECCAESLQETHPHIGALLRDQKSLDELEHMLRTNRSEKLIPPAIFDDQDNGELDSWYKQVAADYLEKNPIGTAEWVFKQFPKAKAHFCRLLLDAEEAEQTLRDLTVHYNFTGLDAEDIPGFLSFINDFCNVLRPLAAIQEQRARAIAQVERITKPRQLDPKHSPHRA
jgi:hypothetical protein